MTLQQALDTGEKGRSVGPQLPLLINNYTDAIEHAQLAYSALALIIDQLRAAENAIIDLTNNNDELRHLILRYLNNTPTPQPPQQNIYDITYHTTTGTAIEHWPTLVEELTHEITQAINQIPTDSDQPTKRKSPRSPAQDKPQK
jgi:hypothetical protein